MVRIEKMLVRKEYSTQGIAPKLLQFSFLRFSQFLQQRDIISREPAIYFMGFNVDCVVDSQGSGFFNNFGIKDDLLKKKHWFL